MELKMAVADMMDFFNKSENKPDAVKKLCEANGMDASKIKNRNFIKRTLIDLGCEGVPAPIGRQPKADAAKGEMENESEPCKSPAETEPEKNWKPLTEADLKEVEEAATTELFPDIPPMDIDLPLGCEKEAEEVAEEIIKAEPVKPYLMVPESVILDVHRAVEARKAEIEKLQKEAEELYKQAIDSVEALIRTNLDQEAWIAEVYMAQEV